MSHSFSCPQPDLESELAHVLTLRLCHRAVLQSIGEELGRLSEPPHGVPHQLLVLIVQLNEQLGANRSRCATALTAKKANEACALVRALLLWAAALSLSAAASFGTATWLLLVNSRLPF